jgi:hypothetical protein
MELPEHLWLEICTYLTPKELCTLALVSRSFSFISSKNYSWHIVMLTKLKKLPSSLNNFKRSFSEVNHMAIKIITDYQNETNHLEKVIENERIRQKRALEYKKSERLRARMLKISEAV